MRSYLDAMDAGYDVYRAVQPERRPPRLLAALGPKMLELAGAGPTARTPTSCRPSTPPAPGRSSAPTSCSYPSRSACSPRTRRSRGRSRGGTPAPTCGCRTTPPTSSASGSSRATSPTAATTGWSTRSARGATSRRCVGPGAGPPRRRRRPRRRPGAGRRSARPAPPGMGGARARVARAVSDFDDVTAIRRRGDTTTYDADLHPGWSILGKPNGGYLLAVLARAGCDVVDTTHPFGDLGALPAGARGRPRRGPRRGRCGTADGSPPRARRCGRATSPTSTRWSPAASCTTSPSTGPRPRRRRCRRRKNARRAATRTSRSSSPTTSTCGSTRRPRRSPTPTGEALIRFWFRLRDGTEPDVLALILAADAGPPTVFNLGRFGWAPTVELTVLLRGLPAPAGSRSRPVPGCSPTAGSTRRPRSGTPPAAWSPSPASSRCPETSPKSANYQAACRSRSGAGFVGRTGL